MIFDVQHRPLAPGVHCRHLPPPLLHLRRGAVAEGPGAAGGFQSLWRGDGRDILQLGGAPQQQLQVCCVKTHGN